MSDTKRVPLPDTSRRPGPAAVAYFDVSGIPAPQGSKRHVGHGILIESSKAVKPWREAVTWAAVEHMNGKVRPVITGPVEICITFYLPRPTTGKARKRASPCVKPDLDKLVRSTFDALKTAGLYEDDSRVVRLTTEKLYLDAGSTCGPGARIMYRPWSGTTPSL